MKKRLNLTNNINLKLLSVIAAIILWIIVVNVEDPEVTRTIDGIPVTPVDEEVVLNGSQVYTITSGSVVRIRVTGPRSEVDKMTKDYFVAQAPFTEKSNVDAVPIYVSFRNSKYDRTCEIIQDTMSMKLKIEDIISKTYEINIEHENELAEGYYLGKESINPTTVTVSAPKSVIDTLNKVTVEPDLSAQTENISMPLNLHYYTGSGSEMTLDNFSTADIKTATYSADIYGVREVPIVFNTTGTVADGFEFVEVVGSLNSVKIAGEDVDGIESIEVPGELINISGASTDVTKEIDISAQLPTGVYLYDSSQAKISVIAKIEPLETKAYNIPVSEIDKINVPQGYSAVIEESQVSLVLIGLARYHDEMDIDKLEAYVDLKNTVEGDNEVIVKFTLPDGLKQNDEVRVTVRIEKNDTGTESETETELETTSPQEDN